MNLIDSLINGGWLKTQRIIEAFRKIKRVDFLPEEMKDLAELNEALPIGFGQTISQPLVVAFMLELLQPQEGDKILDIGSGSGWTSGLLAEIVSSLEFYDRCRKIQEEAGRVIAIEIIPELKEFGEKNVAKYNFIEKGIVEFICAGGSRGYKKEAPFDKILASASVYPVRNKISNGAREIPLAWKEQLKIGGRIVTPIGTSIWLFVKKSPSFAKATEGEEAEGEEGKPSSSPFAKAWEFEETEYPGFVFVPLIEK